MSPTIIFAIILLYFSLLMLISRLTSRHTKDHTFLTATANRRGFWWRLAWWGSGISAVSLCFYTRQRATTTCIISSLSWVRLWVISSLFCIDPHFYKLKLVSIYAYLDHRFGALLINRFTVFLVSPVFGAAPGCCCRYKYCSMHSSINWASLYISSRL